MIISKIQIEFEKEGYKTILTEVVDPDRLEKSPFYCSHFFEIIWHVYNHQQNTDCLRREVLCDFGQE